LALDGYASVMSQTSPAHGFLDDVIARRLLDLATSVEQSLGSAVRVERRELFCGEVRLLPARPDAMSVSWIDFGDELGLYAGTRGWWELGRDLADVAFVEDVVRSIVAGRVEEVLAPGRSRLVVTMPDGSRTADTGADAPIGCLPLPWWPRWGRRVSYAPYD
jgi:hypothetical protein